MCASEPVEHEEPAGQAVHWLATARPGVLLKEPSVHGSGAEAPASQYEPATQTEHAVLPLSFMNLPASHLSHVDWALAGCTVPGLHSEWVSEPVEQNDPSGQSVHSPLLPSPKALLNVPSSHGSGALLPASQNEPAGHARHSTPPLSFMNVPATQSTHSFWL